MVFEAYIGPAAGVGTSIAWTATSLLFTAACRRIGVTLVNSLRIALAIVFLGVTHRLLSGMWWPDVVTKQVMLLGFSGMLGLAIGDQALLISFIDIGPRLATLIMTSSPLIAAVLGWLVLGEALSGIACLGIIITVAGIAWVVLERPGGDTPRQSPNRIRGLILAFVGAAGQAGGMLLSKQGMGHGWLEANEQLDPQGATLIRMVGAAIGMVPLLIYAAAKNQKRTRNSTSARQKSARNWGILFASIGAVAGPYLGVWMSLIAVDRAQVGVAQTLCSLTPVFLLPCVAIMYKERVSARAAIGAMVAVAGSALLVVKVS